jgi:hypothetical protein
VLKLWKGEKSKTIDSQKVTEYSYIMTQKDKILDKAKRNPEGLSFLEFQNLLSSFGWNKDRQKGCHEIWYSIIGDRISIQNRHGNAKGYQVKQFLKYLQEVRK